MSEFKFNCPQCGQEIEADETYRGQVAACPYCGKGIVVPRISPKNSSSRSRSFVPIGKRYSQPSAAQPLKHGNRKLIVWIAIGVFCLSVLMSVAFYLGKNSQSKQVEAGKHMKDDAVASAKGSDKVSEDSALDMLSAVSGKALENSSEELSENEENGKTATIAASNTEKTDKVKTTETVEPDTEKPVEVEKTAESAAVGTPEHETRTTPIRTVDGSIIKGRNPLELFQFGDTPKDGISIDQDGIARYKIIDFLGIQRLVLGYTAKNHLFSICLVSENDHYSSAESDARVSKLMQLCDEWDGDADYDEWYKGIDWKMGNQEHDGRRFAIGRVKVSGKITTSEGVFQRKYADKIFSIIPTRGPKNIVGLQVNLIDNRLRRLDNDYSVIDMRHPFKVSDAQYKKAKAWLHEQLNSNMLRIHEFEREYDTGKLCKYSWRLKRGIVAAGGSVTYDANIYLENGVLTTGGTINIDEGYAEELIKAQIFMFNKEMEGIDGDIKDCNGFGVVTLPCPICHGDKTRQRGRCKCENDGKISIRYRDFKHEFEDYKADYKSYGATARWRKQSSQRAKPKYESLQKEEALTAEERAIEKKLRREGERMERAAGYNSRRTFKRQEGFRSNDPRKH